MIDAIKKYFRRKTATQTPQQKGQGVEPVPLRIEGVKPAPLTPEPDEAELAAQALLESMCDVRSKMEDIRDVAADAHQPSKSHQPSAISHHTSEYYHALAERIRTARTAEARLAMRLLASVEEQLAEPTALYRGQWGDTERKLYRALDIAEREGGELHRRWQHCLANVLVRRMEEEREATEDGRRKMEDGSGEGTQVPHLRDAATDNANTANSEPSNPANSKPSNPANSEPANPANSGAAGDNDNSSPKV